MFDFAFEPWIVGDISTLGLMEELQENSVNDAVEYIRRRYDTTLSIGEMEEVFELFDIDYAGLPKYLQDRFDEFEVY